VIQLHAFVDESARSGYLVCAAVLASNNQTDLRKALKRLCARGQSRIHMTNESPSRRREILSSLGDLGLQTTVYETALNRHTSQRTARDLCLAYMAQDFGRCRSQAHRP